MLHFVGDLHGDFRVLNNLPDNATWIIQVGDFGFWPYLADRWMRQIKHWSPDRKIFFIDGNHDYHPLLCDLKEVTEVWPKLWYIPRGTIWDDCEGYRIGFIGGAASPDYKWRLAGSDWFPQHEAISARQAQSLLGVELDLLVTHTAPQSWVDQHMDQRYFRRDFGLSESWVDPSSHWVEAIWKSAKQCPLICGHMHISKHKDNVRILNTNEIFTLETNTGDDTVQYK